MASTRFVALIFFILLIIIISIFSARMNFFRKGVTEATETISCLEEDNRKILTEEECYYDYDGILVLKKFNNVPPTKICCQLK